MLVNKQMCCDYVHDIPSANNVCTLFKVTDQHEQSPTSYSDRETDFADCIDSTASSGQDTVGNGCEWYNDNSGSCGSFDGNGFTASTDCCICGGGQVDIIRSFGAANPKEEYASF